MRPDVAVTEFLYAHEYAEKSQRWYRGMLGLFATYCGEEGIADISEVSAPMVRRFFDTIRQRTDPRTGQPVSSQAVHGYARAVRAFLNWAVQEGLLDERVPKRVAMPKREEKVIPTLSADHVERLLRAAESVCIVLKAGRSCPDLQQVSLMQGRSIVLSFVASGSSREPSRGAQGRSPTV